MSSTDPTRAHHHAIKAILDQAFAAGGEAYRVYFGEVTDSDDELTYPYLIIWPAPGRRSTTSLDGTGHEVRTMTRLTAVGQSQDEVLAALDRAADALQGARPTMPGRNPGQIKQNEDLDVPVTQDDTVRTPSGRPVFTGFAEYRLTSVPA